MWHVEIDPGFGVARGVADGQPSGRGLVAQDLALDGDFVGTNHGGRFRSLRFGWGLRYSRSGFRILRDQSREKCQGKQENACRVSEAMPLEPM